MSNSSIQPCGLEIREYIQKLLKDSRQQGKPDCILLSGNIHRSMNLQNRMPSVCRAMRQSMRSGDEVIHTTPSGQSSTIEIKYYFNNLD